MRKLLYLVFSALCLLALPSCGKDDDNSGGDGASQGSADIVGKLCNKVWINDGDYCVFTFEFEDSNWYYLTKYIYCPTDDKSPRGKSYQALSKKDGGFMVDLWFEAALPSERRRREVIEAQDADGWLSEYDEGERESAHWSRYGYKILSVSDNELKMADFDQSKSRKSFEEIKQWYYDSYGITLLCPDSPEILNKMCANGDFYYAGNENSDFWYSATWEENISGSKLSKKPDSNGWYKKYRYDRGSLYIRYCALDENKHPIEYNEPETWIKTNKDISEVIGSEK